MFILKKDDKNKIGRPKLANTKQKRNALIMVMVSFVLIVALVFNGLFSLNIINTSNLIGSSGTFTIYFTNKRAANGSGEMKKQIVTYGTKAKIKKITYKNKGYIFRGWIMQRTGDNYYYGYDYKGNLGWYKKCSKWYYFENQDDISNIADVGQKLRLYADWSKKKDTYKIIYTNKHATKPSGTMKNQIISTNFSVKLRANEFKNGSNSFIGWVAYRASDKKTYGYDKYGKLGWYKNSNSIVKYYFFKDQETIKDLVKAGDTVSMIAFYKNTLLPKNLMIYLSPEGKDTNIGTINNRILTLKRAHEIIKEEVKIRNVKNIKIIVAPGIYYNQSTDWTYNNDKYSITITAEDKKDIPVFKYEGDNDLTWFFLNGSSAKSKNVNIDLKISYMKVEGYYRGLFLTHGYAGTFSNITVSNMYFNKIGTKYAYAERFKKDGIITASSDACLALIDVKDSVISNNKFYNIENTPKNNWKYDYTIHAIYIKRSTNNVIKNNNFKYVSSDPIRLRDRANNNKITKNTFSKAGLYSYISEFYWPDASKDYPEPYVKKEAKSEGNDFSSNTLGYSYYYDEYLPYANIIKSNYDGTVEIKTLSRYSELTNNEKKVFGTNIPIVTNAANTSTSSYKDFKKRIYVHGSKFKK